MWSIVNSFFFLLGDAVASLEEAHGDSTASEQQGDGKAFAGEDAESSASVNGKGSDTAVSLATQPSTPSGGQDPSAVLLPAHLLAVAGEVDEWLPGWLRSLPTGRLVRAVDDAGLLGAMARRCKSRGRIPFDELHGPAVAAASNGTGDTTVSSRVPSSALPEACLPKAAVVRHRFSVGAGSSGVFCSAGSAAPLGRALWLPAAELERALLVQSVSFLGILATHCRGTLRPCPSAPDDEEGSEGRLPGGEMQSEAGEDGIDRGLEQGKEALQALVQCATRDSCRAGWGMNTQRLPRKSQAAAVAAKKDAGSRSVRCMALGYVGQLAKATAGGILTPFTRPIIDCLFAPLGGTQSSNGEGQGGSLSERESSDHGCGRGADGLMVDESPAFLGALAEIAGVLLSSRGASAGFSVNGPEGPQASRALLELSRCTAELARRACCYGGGLDGRQEEGGGISLEGGHAGAPARRFPSPEREDSKRLAVEFACALAPIMSNPPNLRAAGWAALWRSGVPRALAKLVAFLGDPRPDQSAFEKEKRRKVSDRNGHASGRSGTGGTGGGGDHDSAQEDGDLRDRLLLSLVEWARDLGGVNALRQVGLAGPCGSFLSRELGRRHLDRSTRDECADPRLLAVAMRLALCPEGLGELLSAGGGVADGVQGGLSRLGELTTLPEWLQSHTVGLPPPHAIAPRSLSGHDGELGGCVGEDMPGRSRGLQLGGDAGDLRCLDLVCRLSVSGTLCPGLDPADPAVAQMKRWLRWGLSRVVPSRKASFGAGDVAMAEDADDVAQDVRVVALELVTNLAADLTTAVSIEAEWSLAEALAWQKADEEPASVRTSIEAGARGEAAGRATSEAGVGLHLVCGDGGGKYSVGSITSVPDIVEPASLGRARLAVSLTRLGGPNEERHKLLRKLREAEALAGSHFVGSGSGGAPAAPVRTASGIQGMSEGVEFPDDSASDEDWWDAAGRCVPTVVALLAGPRGARSTEAFSLLRKAAARRSLLCPDRARPTGRAAMDCSSPRGNGERGGSVLAGELSESRQAVMNGLCFSYARSLGLVDDSGRERFGAGLKVALAAAAGSTSSPSLDCDWFAAVAFVASGADGAAASAMLQALRRDTARAAFVLPLAGKRYAVPVEISPPATSERGRSSPGVAAGRASERVDGIASGFCISPSPFIGDGTAAAADSLLLLLALVEEVLEEELPLLSAALRSSGWAAASLAGRWMRQSMLCVVDWPGVVAYLALALLRGHDYQVGTQAERMTGRCCYWSHFLCRNAVGTTFPAQSPPVPRETSGWGGHAQTVTENHSMRNAPFS